VWTLAARALATPTIAPPPAIVGHAQVIDRPVFLAEIAVTELLVQAARFVLVPALGATAGSPMRPVTFTGRMVPGGAPPFPATLASLGCGSATRDRGAPFAATRTPAALPGLPELVPAAPTRRTGVQQIGRLVAFVAVVTGLRERFAFVHRTGRTPGAAATAAPPPAAALAARELVPASPAGGACVQEVGRVLHVPRGVDRIGRLVPVGPGAAVCPFAHIVSPFRRR
jgi:hypothetical protein